MQLHRPIFTVRMFTVLTSSLVVHTSLGSFRRRVKDILLHVAKDPVLVYVAEVRFQHSIIRGAMLRWTVAVTVTVLVMAVTVRSRS